MGEDHDRRAVALARPRPFLKPVELLRPQASQAAGFKLATFTRPMKWTPFMIEASPARAARALPVALEVQLAVIREDVVLARHIEDLPHLGSLEDLGKFRTLRVWRGG